MGRGRDSLQESESFIHSNRFACYLLLSVLDTVWKTKVLANKSEKIFPASKCSKDLLGINITSNSSFAFNFDWEDTRPSCKAR